jgi:hypothetical protein
MFVDLAVLKNMVELAERYGQSWILGVVPIENMSLILETAAPPVKKSKLEFTKHLTEKGWTTTHAAIL